MTIGFGIDCTAEHSKDCVCKEQIDRSQHNAADQAHHHSVANTLLCLADLILPKADADKCTAAITDHDCNGQRDHRQWKNNRVGGIAVGAKIGRICNENLIYDIVQRADQQRNNARDRIFLHQPSDALRAKELIRAFHEIHLTFKFLDKQNNEQPPCNRFYA